MKLKFSQFPARLQKDIAESENFQRALQRLKNGKAATPRSWVYENVKDPKQVLDSWIGQLKNLSADKDLKDIAEWDLSKQDKFAPQGLVAPFNERLETLSEYWAHVSPITVPDQKIWDLAKKLAIKDLGFNQSGKPISVDAVINRGLKEDKYNTSSGDPLFLKRKNPIAISQAKKAATDGSWKNYFPVLGSRASMGKTGANARWIFMFPMSVNLVEQSFQQPLQDYIRSKKDTFFAPWDGYERVQEELSKYSPHTLKFGCDYTKMDQHFNIWHAEQCFEVIKCYFQPKYWDSLHESIQYTFQCSVVSCDGLIVGSHAMPSGSGWTNFLETVFNYILVRYFALKYHLRFVASMGIGDDQLWFLEYHGNISKLTDLVVSVFTQFGLDANPEKQEVSQHVASFLQRQSYSFWKPYGVTYAGVYPTIRALTSLMFPEFYHNDKDWTSKTFALRCLMILENCQNHPLFKEFCIFIAKGNDNIIKFAKMPDAELLLVRHSAKKIANFIPTYNQAAAEMNPVRFKSLAVIREWLGVA